MQAQAGVVQVRVPRGSGVAHSRTRQARAAVGAVGACCGLADCFEDP